ncbi:ABC1-domain-containing protein [Tilletiopsis washingtonensis]|uniref:ABC1-domain-containing protein n=1 Tax=Tilletiopsis washingtonensis TaxID=58919 RepID=A0A316ZI46_9BASI|nr:ABC1-domain-containing protein [Tilletiopsis washingtonensis]PWO01182.1 ABC1-domain-containing protein [Tilletiopsis washingtonensis]
MRVLHDGKAATADRPDSADALKRLDASFEAYFGDAPQSEAKTSEAELPVEPQSKLSEAPSSDSHVAEAVDQAEREATSSQADAAAPLPTGSEDVAADEPSPPPPISQAVPSPTQASTPAAAPAETAHVAPDPQQPVAAAPETQAPEAQALEAQAEVEEYDATTAPRATPLRAAKVPSSRIARALHYGGLGAGLAWGAAGSFFSGSGRGESGKEGSANPILGDSNVRRLVDKLSTMRGAALKLGQFLSIQDSNMLPPQLEEVLLRVQNSAHYMPAWQMERVMQAELGPEWRKQFSSFSDVPFASASIGQVHAAVLAEDHPSPLAGQRVAIKIQFPGVRSSIASDLGNLRWLLAASALLPKGLFLDNTIRVMQRELDDECDYVREADMIRRFGELTKDSQVFAVPRVVDELSTAQVLTTEMMRGRPLTQAARYTQDKRDQIAKSILELSLRELFEYRLMQTDPNWTNFLYNERTGKIELIDFGAARAYDKPFIDDWLCMLRAAIGGRRDECVAWSEKVGYLTGQESEAMRDAHVDSMIALGEPFRADAPNPYPFAEQTITARVRAQIPLMLRERLTPPPEQTYSLNRKLSGAFLLCARLGARVSCNTMLSDVTRDYVLENTPPAGVPQRTSGTSIGSDRRGLHTSRILREVEQAERRRQRTREI